MPREERAVIGRHVAPAGAPIRAGDLPRWLAQGAAPDAGSALAKALQVRFAVRHAELFSTGRAGMTVLLKALGRLAPPQRAEVIIPAYTCYSVAAAAVKAGLRPRLVDIAPETLDFDRDALARVDFSRVLAVVATNLYGLPCDMPFLAQLAKENGCFLVDDAAQSMGATVGGRPSGTWGDAGLFSFDKGKPIAAIDGGAVVTSSDAIAAALSAETAALPSGTASQAVKDVVKALAYFVLLRPWLYWIPNSVPQLELGKTVFTTEFPLARLDRPLTALATTALRHLDEYRQVRVANARALVDALRDIDGLTVIGPRAGADPGYLRAPLLVSTPAARDAAIDRLREAGIGATGSYPAALADVPELAPLLAGGSPVTGARHVAARILTLPTHPFVAAGDRARMVATLRQVAADAKEIGTPQPLEQRAVCAE